MEIVKWLNDTIIWGIPMLVLMLGTGLYLTFKTRAVIFTRFGTVMANTLKTVFRKPKEIEAGTITPSRQSARLWPERSGPAISSVWPWPSASAGQAPSFGCGPPLSSAWSRNMQKPR